MWRGRLLRGLHTPLSHCVLSSVNKQCACKTTVTRTGSQQPVPEGGGQRWLFLRGGVAGSLQRLCGHG